MENAPVIPPVTDIAPIVVEDAGSNQPELLFPIPVRRKRDVKIRPHGTSREEELLHLFGTDYEFLKENGDLDIFHVSRAQTKDSLLHILTGDSFDRQARGYHSQAASAILGLSSVEKPTFREDPEIQPKDDLSPYRARTFVNGYEKPEKTPGKPNSFWPDGFDPTAIVRYISYAYKNRDTTQDRPLTNSAGRELTMGHCLVPCGADGSDVMNIELAMNASGKIISAYPIPVEEMQQY